VAGRQQQGFRRDAQNDTAPRVYTVDMTNVPGWIGRMKQLRLDLATGATLTGTCRIDYLWHCK